MTHAEAGRRGGLKGGPTTAALYDMRERGRNGGRVGGRNGNWRTTLRKSRALEQQQSRGSVLLGMAQPYLKGNAVGLSPALQRSLAPKTDAWYGA